MYSCYKCKLRKPAEAFGKDKSRSSGLCSKCSGCMKLAKKEWRQNNSAYKLARAADIQRWKINHPERFNAQKAVQSAVRAGKLVKPDMCSKCDGLTRVEGHHPDYSKQLEVVWLCQKCHLSLHAEQWSKSRATVS